jgi:hypothetical protein
MLLRPTTVALPPDLRARLEKARLDLLALFRALDHMDLSPAEIPQQQLRQLFELDADYGEALWALDQPQGKLNQRAMLRDTLAVARTAVESHTQVPQLASSARTEYLSLPRAFGSPLAQCSRGVQHGSG